MINFLWPFSLWPTEVDRTYEASYEASFYSRKKLRAFCEEAYLIFAHNSTHLKQIFDQRSQLRLSMRRFVIELQVSKFLKKGFYQKVSSPSC